MGYVKKKSHKGEYSVIYSDMLGADMNGDGSNIAKNRFAYLENMYRDYRGGRGSLESVPGYRKLFNTGDTVYGIYSFTVRDGRDMLVIHSGTRYEIYCTDALDTATPLYSYRGVCAARSAAYFMRGKLYILDGEHITVADENGFRDATNDIYVPTVAFNYREYEQRNLLTRRAVEKYTIGSAEDISLASEGLLYEVLDSEERTLKIVGYSGSDKTLYVPSRIKIGDNFYTVRQIGARAFMNSGIEECYISSGAVTVGNLAFYNCSALRRVVLPDTVCEIGNAAFSLCRMLDTIHIGHGLMRFGNTVFQFCDKLERIGYAGSEAEWSAIEGAETYGNIYTVDYDEKNLSAALGIAITSPATAVTDVTIDGKSESYLVDTRGGLVSQVRIFLPDKSALTGKTVEIRVTLAERGEDYGTHGGFVPTRAAGAPEAAIFGCKLSAGFDGRIFLSGNKSYPGVTFYSGMNAEGECDPLYFGEYNFFVDGDEGYDNVGLLPLGDTLLVFKGRGSSGGTVFYRKSLDTGEDVIPRIYPVCYFHSGIYAKSGAFAFHDEGLFITDSGLVALVKNSTGDGFHIEDRSAPIRERLLRCELERVNITSYLGYLVLAAGEYVFLGDPRCPQGYEWYMLTDVGSHTDDRTVYRYADRAREGFYTGPIGERAEGTVMSVKVGSDAVYYVNRDGRRYEVYPTEEREGGTLLPATLVHGVGERLFFAASDGSVSVFNNDKRGVAPPQIASAPGFNEEDYRAAFGDVIHPYFYSHAGHAVRYALKTAKDNCGIPHLEKDSVNRSLTVKCHGGRTGGGKITVEVGTDGDGWREVVAFPGTELCFADVDFANMTMATDDSFTAPISERRRGWVEKQISIYTDAFCAPFGIYSIAYRFTVRGRVRPK